MRLQENDREKKERKDKKVQREASDLECGVSGGEGGWHTWDPKIRTEVEVST